MAKKRKYYVVWEGNEPGIYDNWTDCQLQVKGYPNAKYQAFTDKDAAERAYAAGYQMPIRKKKPVASPDAFPEEEILWDSVSVDAACSGNPGVMEYRGVETKTGTEIFHMGPFKQGTNNIGEFLALVHALALLKMEGKHDMPIYSDSRIAIGWVERGKAKTRLQKNRHNQVLFTLISRAEAWLKKETFKNPIYKWETKRWGEIPADFGRK